MNNCKETEIEYPYDHSPHIEYTTIEFFGAENMDIDTLKLIIKISDLEGDVGANKSFGFDENNPLNYPYHKDNIVIDSQSRIVTFSGIHYIPPFYLAAPNPNSIEKKLFNTVDSRPKFDCFNYSILGLNESQTNYKGQPFNRDFSPDTVYIQKNPNRCNIEIEYYILKNGKLELFDWLTAFDETSCSGLGFNGLFPSINNENTPYKLIHTNIYDWQLEYTMRSAGFHLILKDNPFKLKIKIRDAAFNLSNEIETDLITIN
jgi:hypothetical protein